MNAATDSNPNFKRRITFMPDSKREEVINNGKGVEKRELVFILYI